MSTDHNTTSTILGFRHLTSQLQRDLHTEVIKAEDHDSLHDGEPVASVIVDHKFEVYPVDGTETRKSIGGEFEVPKRRWALDLLVDDSDPSVGLFGCSPVEHGLYDNFGAMLIELGRLVMEDRINDALNYEAEEALAAEMEAVDRLCSEYQRTIA